jgi:hypothetical protein
VYKTTLHSRTSQSSNGCGVRKTESAPRSVFPVFLRPET